jgi:hypothetical protein
MGLTPLNSSLPLTTRAGPKRQEAKQRRPGMELELERKGGSGRKTAHPVTRPQRKRAAGLGTRKLGLLERAQPCSALVGGKHPASITSRQAIKHAREDYKHHHKHPPNHQKLSPTRIKPLTTWQTIMGTLTSSKSPISCRQWTNSLRNPAHSVPSKTMRQERKPCKQSFAGFARSMPSLKMYFHHSRRKRMTRTLVSLRLFSRLRNAC